MYIYIYISDDIVSIDMIGTGWEKVYDIGGERE